MLKQQDMTETARVVFNELSVTEPATVGEIAQNTYLSRERCQLILTQLVMAGLADYQFVVRMLRLCVNWLMWQEPPKRLMCCACVSILLTRTALVRMKKRSSRKLLRRCSCRWSSTCEKCAPCAGCHPAVSGSGGGFHRTADVGAGRWCAGGDGAGRTLAFTA